MQVVRTFSFLSVLVTLSTFCPADEWPQFRGPSGDGQSQASDLPLTFDDAADVVWKSAIDGLGYSSPVVFHNRLYITTAIVTPASPELAQERTKDDPLAHLRQVAARVVLRAVCLDCDTGRIRYDVEVLELIEPMPIQDFNTYASPTPIIDNNRLYCDFGEFGTVCLDVATGKVLWTRHLPIQHFVGPGSSPAICGDVLVLVRDGGDQQYIMGVDKLTGETVWRTPRPPIDSPIPQLRKAFSTPLLIDADGRQQLVIPGAQWVVAYEPATGAEIWRVNHGRGFSNVPRPVYGHGMVYICTGFPQAELWAIRVSGQGDVTETHVAWKAEKQVPKRSSPILVGGELFVVSDGGIATCFDAVTGATNWQERLPGDYSASPIATDGKVYFFGESGHITVVRAGKEYQQLATSRIDGRLMASPAIAGKAIFIRTDTHMYRFE